VTQQARGPRDRERWAHLRFSVIGQLLAAPPPNGELRAEIEALAARQWHHPSRSILSASASPLSNAAVAAAQALAL
jgi:hypothetical protein